MRMSISSGMFVGIVGPNGSGKTTLLRAFLGTLRPKEGRIVRANGKLRIGYVPQRITIDPVFPLSVGDLVTMGRYPRIGPFRRVSAEDRRAVQEACERLEIPELRDCLYRDLSGGQQQRALIARALAGKPELLVLDEPTNGMDLVSEHAIMNLITDLAGKERVTVLFVTHLLNLVANRASHLALVHGGRVTMAPREEMLTEQKLSAIYGIPVEVLEVGGAVQIRPKERTQ
ncbi:MAG: metal ABC transporter ATP-binding protein [Planctomycetota bacterium]